MKRKRTSEQNLSRPINARSRLLVSLLIATLLVVGMVLLWRTNQGSTVFRRAEPDIILITIDTLRADAVGFAGNRRVETPFLDQLAKEGRVFENAHAHNVVTLPSHTNILTGLYPYQHGVRDNSGFRLADEQITLAERLRHLGYATGAFVGAFPLDSQYGLAQGFDEYDDAYQKGSNPEEFVVAERRADEVIARASTWYDSLGERKRFLWVHLYDPHAPYDPPDDPSKRYWSEPYLGEVAFVDGQLQRFLQPIISGKRRTLLIVTADHGEALGDHGELTHGLFAYESTLRVPLSFHEPDLVAPAVDRRYVRHIDIAPTVLQRLGVKLPSDWKGQSLLNEGPDRDTYFEALSATFNRGWAPLVGTIQGSTKYIDLPIPELFDLKQDPAELRNAAVTQRRVANRLRQVLARESGSAAVPGSARVTQSEESAKLLSLGYLAGSSSRTTFTIADDPKELVEIDRMLHQAIYFYQLRQVDRAVALAREVVRSRPDMAVGQETLAFFLQQTEKSDEAVSTLRAAMRGGKATESIKIRLGLVLSEMGKADEAAKVLHEFRNGSDPRVLNAYGIALADMGRLVEAKRQFDRVLDDDPSNAAAHQNAGIVLLRANRLHEARQQLTKALALNPDLPLAWNTLGVVHARSGNNEAAIEAWTRAVALDRKQYDALFNLSVVASNAGRIEIARPALERFIETAPPQRYGADIEKARVLLSRL